VNQAALKPSRFGWQSKMLEQFIFKSGLLSGSTVRPRGGVLFYQPAGPANLKFAEPAEFKYDLAPPAHTAIPASQRFSFEQKCEITKYKSCAGLQQSSPARKGSAWPNHSVNLRANGIARCPAAAYSAALHFASAGHRAMPLAPGYLER
jgi:hypothetical protein